MPTNNPVCLLWLPLVVMFAACSGHEHANTTIPKPPVCDETGIVNDIPFNYNLETDHLAIHTPGGVVKTSIGPWGAHTQPHAGHEDGDAKANWTGYFAHNRGELTELEGDGNGLCDVGEVCGLPLENFINRLPQYIAPADKFSVHSVRVEAIQDWYFGTTLAWSIDANLCSFNYRFGHMGKISQDLREKMIAAGYPDPWTIDSVTGNLIDGEPFFLDKGDRIGYPHIFATEVSGHPGYYMTTPTVPPAAQIEFVASRGPAQPFYAWLPVSTQEKLRGILYADALNSASFRYQQKWLTDWLWKAEMDLWTAESYESDDFSSITSRLGSWWEMQSGCLPGTTFCDEVFVIFPILKHTPFYDPALYHSAQVSFLAHYRQADLALGSGFLHYMWGEVIDPAVPEPVSGRLTIKWRRDHSDIEPVYQAIAYQVLPDAKLMKIRWGSRQSQPSLLESPPIPTPEQMCDGVQLTCHSAGFWPWP